MSFNSNTNGRGFNAGYFLESEVGVVRKTGEIPATSGKAFGDRKIVPAGTVIETKGIVYEDVDVTTGNMPGSLVVAGRVYKGLLPTEDQEKAATLAETLTGLTIIDGTIPAVTRPDAN